MDVSLTALRVIREVAERGSFTAAAVTLGYTQSAISRQIAAAEHEVGVQLFDRVTGGVRLTAAGQVLLRQGVIALDALDEAQRELTGAAVEVQRVRLGVFAAAGSALLPPALSLLRRQRPDIEVTSREGSTPSLVRALRAGSIDLAILTSRAPHRSPDQEDPPFHLETLLDVSLALAVPAHGKFSGRVSVTAADVADEPWIASPSLKDEPLLGVWPGLPGRPQVHHTSRDWLTKLKPGSPQCREASCPTCRMVSTSPVSRASRRRCDVSASRGFPDAGAKRHLRSQASFETSPDSCFDPDVASSRPSLHAGQRAASPWQPSSRPDRDPG